MTNTKGPSRLPLIAEAAFDQPLQPHQLITFLNRSLKREGWVFGLSESASRIHLRLYRAEPWEAAKGSGAERDPSGEA